MKIQYVPRKFSAASRQLIEKANVIIKEYAAAGYDLTLRQLYYQFVARAFIANKQSEYKRLGSIINDARLAGFIDWDRIVDRTRNRVNNSHWDGPSGIIDSCVRSYARDKWASQQHYVECWVEKEALIGVLEPICTELDVPYFACRGYVSQSELWAAAMRFKKIRKENRIPYVLHLGDHDPSGIDMSRDIPARFKVFGLHDCGFQRIALTMDQVEEHGPPPNPAKETDIRFKGYQELYGDESWELDALSPSTLTELIREKILELRDEAAWEEEVEKEDRERQLLEAARDRWDEVEQLLDD